MIGDLLLQKLRKAADGKTSIQLLKEFNDATATIIANVNTLIFKKRFYIIEKIEIL